MTTVSFLVFFKHIADFGRKKKICAEKNASKTNELFERRVLQAEEAIVRDRACCSDHN